MRVLPSTAGSATWLILPAGCDPPSSECSNARGGLFDQARSASWRDLGLFTLALEQNLGHNESGLYGLDTISFGLSNATGGPTLESQIIAGIETEHWYTGFLSLQQQPINLTNFSQPQPNILSALRAQNLIPSLSWAYTAGAHYRPSYREILNNTDELQAPKVILGVSLLAAPTPRDMYQPMSRSPWHPMSLGISLWVSNPSHQPISMDPSAACYPRPPWPSLTQLCPTSTFHKRRVSYSNLNSGWSIMRKTTCTSWTICFTKPYQTLIPNSPFVWPMISYPNLQSISSYHMRAST